MTRVPIAALVWLSASLAAADALPPPADIQCREGERIQHDHSGTHCELPYCQTDADCPEGARCPELRCVAYVPNPSEYCAGGGRKEPPDPCAPVLEDRGPCRAEEPRCDGDARCRPSQCVWVDPAPPEPEERPEPPRPTEDEEDEADEEDARGEAPLQALGGSGCCGSSGARARGVGLPLSLILFGAALLWRRDR